MAIDDDLPVLEFEHLKAWVAWLAANHDESKGVWLRIAKKKAPRATVAYPEVLDGAICKIGRASCRERVSYHV